MSSSSSNRLECLGKSSLGSKKQPAVAVTSALAETHKHNDTPEEKNIINHEKPRRHLPSCAPPCSVQETPKSGSLSWDAMNTEVCTPVESINITPKVEEQAESATVSGEELKMKAQPSAITGTTLAAPILEPLPEHEVNGEKEQTDEGDFEEEDLKAPVELIIEFLGALMDRDFQLASKLCQMILIYEPDHPVASEFIPLIQKTLQEEQDAEESHEKEEDDDDDSEDTGSDEESSDSSCCSSSSCSSSSSSSDEEEK